MVGRRRGGQATVSPAAVKFTGTFRDQAVRTAPLKTNDHGLGGGSRPGPGGGTLMRPH